MHSIALYVNGNDEHGRMIRRTLMRYLNLTLILVLRSISSAVKRRFPTLDHVVEAGFMTVIEREMYQSVPSVEFNTYWIPCTWFISLLKETRNSNRISDSQGLKIIMEEFNDFRSKCGLLWSYDWVSIPLVYTQVVTIATYSFFLAALVGRQYVDSAKKPLQMEIDIYIPVFTILQFFFFMGLLKVAEQLINPFGDDDEDFELNWLIDRHTKVSYLGVDILMTRSPPLVKDKYFDEIDLTLPYTEAAVAYKKKTYRGSVHNMQVPEEKHTMFLPEISEEDEDRTSASRNSLHKLHAVLQSHKSPPPTPISAKAAAGIWRSKHPSSQSLAVSEADIEIKGDSLSHTNMGMDEGTANTFHKFPKYSLTDDIFRSPSNFYGSENSSKLLPRSDSTSGIKLTINSNSGFLQRPKSGSLDSSDIELDILENVEKKSTPIVSKVSSHSQTEDNHYKPKWSAIDLFNIENQKLSNLKDITPCSSSLSIQHNWESLQDINDTKRNISGGSKSCPKFLLLKRENSLCNGKRKGVHWRPMVINTTKDPEGDQSKRRKTVDIISVCTETNPIHVPEQSSHYKPLISRVQNNEEKSEVCIYCQRKLQQQQPEVVVEGTQTTLSAPNISFSRYLSQITSPYSENCLASTSHNPRKLVAFNNNSSSNHSQMKDMSINGIGVQLHMPKAELNSYRQPQWNSQSLPNMSLPFYQETLVTPNVELTHRNQPNQYLSNLETREDRVNTVQYHSPSAQQIIQNIKNNDHAFVQVPQTTAKHMSLTDISKCSDATINNVLLLKHKSLQNEKFPLLGSTDSLPTNNEVKTDLKSGANLVTSNELHNLQGVDVCKNEKTEWLGHDGS